jgi:hypothetical protein
MTFSLTRWPLFAAALVGIVAALLMLASCGGGGGSGSSAGCSGTGPTLAGVAAVGSPLVGATVSVVDGAGVAQGSTSTSSSDGSYTVTLASCSATLPFLVEAAGVDMSGAPVVLHSVVQALPAVSGANSVANITPLTEAVVGLLLGGKPLPHFQNAASRHSSWTLLGNSSALAAAATFVKTAIKANLGDAKLTDLTKVDLFADPSYVANKTGQDIAIASVRVQFGTDTNGVEQLQLSNRLILAGNTEVTVNLTTAKANLADTVPAVSAAAVTSTLKATTGNSSVMPNLAGLDVLRSAINQALAQNLQFADIAVLPIFSTAVANIYYDGQNLSGMATQLVAYGAAGYQLNRFQVLGCLDDPVPTKGCTKIAVASLVRDASGNVVDVYRNAVTYASASGWTLRGNDRFYAWENRPITWATWRPTGSMDPAVSPNPATGMQVSISSPEYMQAALQLPNGYSLPFYYCSGALMCRTGTVTSTSNTGDFIADEVLPSTMVGWLGSSDAKPGARYQLNLITLNHSTVNYSNILTTDLPLTTPISQYPVPDGITVVAPLTVARMVAGLNITWANWARANPQLRMIEVRGVITSTITAPVTHSVTVLPLTATAASLPAFTTVPADAQAYTLWLLAQDEQGRRYLSKMVAKP